MQGRLNAETRARAEMLIRAVGPAGFEDHYPHELSGGMRKRASLIRTLVYDPPVILMDEPFGALDAQTRTQLQEDLLRLWNLGRKTIIFVTHDIAEAIALGDRTLVLSRAPAAIAGEHADHHSAPARHSRHHDPSRFRRPLPAHQGAGAMSTQDSALDLPNPRRSGGASMWSRSAASRSPSLLLAGWKIGADAAGPLYVADPFKVLAAHRRRYAVGRRCCATSM